MIGSMALECHSRENGNPEPKSQYPWIPASAGMTNLKNINLTFRNLKMCRKGQEIRTFTPKMGLIWTAVMLLKI
jgi:hypothetical protein